MQKKTGGGVPTETLTPPCLLRTGIIDATLVRVLFLGYIPVHVQMKLIVCQQINNFKTNSSKLYYILRGTDFEAVKDELI